MIYQFTYNYHRLRGSAALVTMTSKVNGKTGTLTPCRSETPENFITKIGHIEYVAGGNTHAKFYGNQPRGVRPTNSRNITSCDFVYLPFPFLSFFLVVAYSNKKAQLSLTDPRDAKACQKLLQIDVLTTL